MVRFVRSDGKTFQFGALYKITEFKGADKLSVDIYSEKRAQGNGDIITGQRIPARIVTIKSVCTSSLLNDKGRRLVEAFFNPFYSFRMYIQYKGDELWIDCKVDTVDLPTANLYVAQKFTLSLWCAYPLFRSVSEFGENIAALTPRLGFPIYTTAASGFVIGEYAFASTIYIANDGDTETYARARILATGNVEGFTLTDGTDSVTYAGTLADGDELLIDFETASVTLNGENANRYLDRTSTFFSIPLGGGNIGYSATSGLDNVAVFIYYNKLYLGV